jgi:hypothetical protein
VTEHSAAARCPQETLAERYEQLRSRVLEQQCSSERHGLTLFLREGMAAWIEAASVCLPGRAPGIVKSPEQSSPPPQGVRREMIHVLASITLNQLPGACSRRSVHEI